MLKSGWAAAAGIGSLVLLLAACGGSGSNSAAGSASSAPLASSAASGTVPSSAPASSATAAATATKSAGSSASHKAKPHKSVAPLPSGGDQSIPAVGTTVMIVQKSAIGYVLAEANHQVVYTYSKDKKGGKPTCTGACADDLDPGHGNPPGRSGRRLLRPVRLGDPRQRCQADHLQRPSALPAQGREAAGNNRQRPGRRLARGQALRQQHPRLTRFIPFIPVRHLAIARS